MNKIDIIVLLILFIILNIGIFLYWLTLPNSADPENKIQKKGRLKYAIDEYKNQIKQESKEILKWIFYLIIGFIIIRYLVFKYGGY